MSRAARNTLFGFSLLGAGLMLFLWVYIGVVNGIYVDFDAKLPSLTQAVVHFRHSYPVLALLSVVAAYRVLFSRPSRRPGAVVISLLVLQIGVIGGTVLLLFLPMFHMSGEVISG